MVEFVADERGVAPAVGKALEVGVVLLYVGLLTTALYGGAVPTYRSAAGAEVADRTLVAAAERVEDAVPPAARRVAVRHRVDLPATIRGANYRIVADGEALVLDHPEPDIGGRVRLALPERVVSVTGEWRSHDDAVVVVRSVDGGVEVRLAEER